MRADALLEKARPAAFVCPDGIGLAGHIWPGEADRPGTGQVVIVNPATGVLARYYHYYAHFLAERGFTVLTYDYRGIGLSRPARLPGCGFRWHQWGDQDFHAVLTFALENWPGWPVQVVGHSVGGYLPGLSPAAAQIARILTIGAQYAYWRDYAPLRFWRQVWRWHVVMPVLTAWFGYFPGRKLGWLEDLPAGVAREWAFRRIRMEDNHPPRRRADLLAGFAAVTAPILAIAVEDDDLACAKGIDRTLAYYRHAPRQRVTLPPARYGLAEIGHFSLFHTRHRDGFWQESLEWLLYGRNPWGEDGSGIKRP